MNDMEWEAIAAVQAKRITELEAELRRAYATMQNFAMTIDNAATGLKLGAHSAYTILDLKR